MKAMLRGMLRSYFRRRGIVTVPLGKGRGTRLHYHDDLNTDMLLGLHEPNTFEVFSLLIRPGMVVADVGANIGYFSVHLSRCVGPTGRVYAFEPMPETFARLQATVALNELSNVTCINKAVGMSDGRVPMHAASTHYMASLDSRWSGDRHGVVEVECVTLDAFAAGNGVRFDFIKLDVEGGGVFALPGMAQVIKEQQPILLLESHTPEEDLAIGAALSLAPYAVHRVGSEVPVKHLDRDYRDEFGVYQTVIGIPMRDQSRIGASAVRQFQRRRLGQR